jgi:hypothetical protein
VTALSAFLRKTPGEALREYFDRPEIGLPTEFDWSVPEAELSRPLLGAVEKMSRVQRDRISNDAERVHALSDEPGQAAIYSVAEDPAFLDGLANPHARSLWMPEEASDEERAVAFAKALARRAVLAWDGIGDADGKPIDPSPEAIDALLDVRPIFEAFQLTYVSKGLLLEQEKNGSALSPNGPSVGASDTAAPAKRRAKAARRG